MSEPAAFPSPPIEETRKIIKSLSAVSDRKIRPFLLAEKLQPLPNETILQVVRDVYYHASLKINPFFEVYLTVIDVDKIADKLGPARMSEIYRLAVGGGFLEIAGLFARPNPKVIISLVEREKANYELNEVPLGRKKTMARSGDLRVIKKVSRELHPHVIEILLANPKMTEDVVVEMAARRPTAAEIQREIFLASKWILRHKVRRALILNPYTPPDISIRLLNLMNPKDLADVRKSDFLHVDVIDVARLLTERRDKMQ